ncbi:hypothetical protein [Helicobacter ganmani]|uniref:hypothetical protein n=1 Tax=Helicobacter ganmani TaxID=60246 RepID=UPI003A8A095C
MTQVAKMILNELPISPTINEKIEFIKSSKLDFKDFNNFRLLLNSLENFEPSSKLSPKEYKAQINRRIGAFLERLNILEKKIKSTQDLQIKQEHESNEVLNKNENQENPLSDRAKYFYLLAEIETFANKTEQDSQTLGKLLEKTSELLLNTENLNEDEIDTLEETKESLQEYFTHLKQNENERQFSNISPNLNLISRKQEIYDLLVTNVTDSYPYDEMKEYDEHCIIFDESMDIKLALQFKKELEKLNFKVKFLEDDTTSTRDNKRYVLIFGDNEGSVLNAYGTLLDTECCSTIDNDLLKESTLKESQSNEITQNVSNESQKDLPQNNIRFDENTQMLMVGDDVYRMGLDGVVYKIINYGSEKQFSEKSQKLNPKNLNLEDMYRKNLEGMGINVDEIFKINKKSQDSNPQTIKTSLFDDEEVKPQKKRMG